MQKYVALIRGLNVGGHNKLAMKDLISMLEAADCEKVTTYIQSGNAVFRHKLDHDSLTKHLETAFEGAFGYVADFVLRSEEELTRASENYPFFDEERELKFMMTGFAKTQMTPDAQSIFDDVAVEGELVSSTGSEVHFYFGNGSGRSTLAALNFAKKVGTPITVRNRRTISKLIELMAAL